MIQEVNKFIQYIESDSIIRNSITNMSINDFTNFIKKSGFSFSMADFVTTMKELDKNTYANNDELSDEDLNQISAGAIINILPETLRLFQKFYV